MEQRGSDFPVMIGQSGPLNGQKYIIDHEVVIGRDEGCFIIIPDRQVSRYHARLIYIQESKTVTIEDLSSKNGTFINGKKIEGVVTLEEGNIIQVAMFQQFIFLNSDATLPMEFSKPFGEKTSPPCRLYIDSKSRRVWVLDKELSPPLSVPQYKLLQVLYDEPLEVHSRQDLILGVWGEQESYGVSDQALDALIRRLRERLMAADPDHEYIITVRGYGLRLDNPEN